MSLSLTGMTPQSSSSLFSSRGNIGNKFSAKYEKQRSITNSPGPAWFGWLARLTEASQQQPPRRPRRSQIAFARQIDCEEVAGGRGAAPPCRAPDIIKPPEFTAVATGPGAARRREDGNTAHRRRGERGAACRGRVAVRRCGPRHGGAGVASGQARRDGGAHKCRHLPAILPRRIKWKAPARCLESRPRTTLPPHTGTGTLLLAHIISEGIFFAPEIRSGLSFCSIIRPSGYDLKFTHRWHCTEITLYNKLVHFNDNRCVMHVATKF